MSTRWKILLVVNPMAAGVKRRGRRAVTEALASHDVTVVETTQRDHATDLARQAAADGFGAVVVLGGDGTLNEAANGLIGSDTALAALPGGSTSVYARTVGLSRRPRRAAAQLNEALAENSVRRVSVGSVNGRRFLFHLGIGFDAAVVGQVESYARFKRYVGQAVFVYAGVTTWFRHYDRRRSHFTVELDNGETVDDGYFCICLNTNPYTFLGPRALDVAPEATGETGFAVVTLQKLRVPTIVGVMSRAVRKKGRVSGHPDVDYRIDQPSLTIVAHGPERPDRAGDTGPDGAGNTVPVPYQADGDYLGEAEKLTVTHEPDALTMVVPTNSRIGQAPSSV